MSIANVTSQQLLSSFARNSSDDQTLDEIGYDDFLTLLIAELEHQDPMQPMDSSEFTAQLAQFSSVEQLYGIKEIVSDVQQRLASQGEQNPVDLIGKTVTAADDTVVLQGGEVRCGHYTLPQPADVTVQIYNSQGVRVRTLFLEDQPAGEHAIAWDGTDDNRHKLGSGTYRFEVSARNAKGQAVGVDSYATGEVTGITYAYGEPRLIMGDRLVNARQDIVEVRQTRAAAP